MTININTLLEMGHCSEHLRIFTKGISLQIALLVNIWKVYSIKLFWTCIFGKNLNNSNLFHSRIFSITFILYNFLVQNLFVSSLQKFDLLRFSKFCEIPCFQCKIYFFAEERINEKKIYFLHLIYVFYNLITLIIIN